MVVVQDEHKIVREGSDFVEQGRQACCGRGRLRRVQHTQHPFAQIRCNRLQSRDEVGQKARQVAIALRPVTARRPAVRRLPAIRDQRTLAKAGRGGDKRQLAVQTFVQPLDQVGTSDNFGAWGE